MRNLFSALSLIGLLQGACAQPNPTYCDEQTPCPGAGEYCDVDGTSAEAGGIANTCVVRMEPPVVKPKPAVPSSFGLSAGGGRASSARFEVNVAIAAVRPVGVAHSNRFSVELDGLAGGRY